jgi:hypothetical protein
MGRQPAASLGLVAIALLAGSVAGCGGGGDDGAAATVPRPGPLSAGQRRQVDRAEQRIAAYCRRYGRSVGQGRGAPPAGAQRRGFAATDELIALARQNPQGVVRPGLDLRTLLGDVAENLEGSNCDPRLVARLERALTLLPAPGT